MNHSVYLSILLLAAGGASVACVLYTIQGNFKPKINKLLFTMGISLLVWSVGLAVQSGGANASIRYLGSRIAPLGYATMFGVLLHYVLLLTGHKQLVQRWWIRLLLYLPGAVTIYGFSLWPLLTRTPDRMLPSPLGWVNANANGWVTFYYIYYVVFFVVTMLVLVGWNKSATTDRHRRQARHLMTSLWVATVLGSITDAGLGFANIHVPSMAPLFTFAPIVTISYSVHKYGFMQPETIDPNQVILDGKNRARVYRILGICFLAGSVVNLANQHIFSRETGLVSSLLFSGILLLFGAATLLLSSLRINELFKELLFAMLLSLAIPLITLRFVVYGSITIWAWFFLPLLVSLLFNRRLLLVTILLSSVLTQLMVWSATPSTPVRLDEADYVVRLGLLGLAAALCLYINHIYRHRLRANAEHVYRQRLVSGINQSLISADEINFDEKIASILAQCGPLVQCEQVYLTLHSREPGAGPLCWQWKAENTPCQRPACEQGMPLFARYLRQEAPGQALLAVSDVDSLPPQAEEIKSHLKALGVGGFLFLPIRKNGEELGCLSFATARTDMDWQRNPPLFLSIIANTIADTVAKLEDLRRIEWIAYHDDLTGLPNRLLFKQKLGQAIADAQRAGGQVGVALLDLDAFKTINDALGHEAGDELLTKVAGVIARHLREQDTLARFGGDEFVLLLNQVTAGQLEQMAQTTLNAIQQPVVVQGQEFFVTGSMGLALYPQDGTDAETLMKNADVAMYEAKTLGRNRYALCSPLLKNKALNNAKLTSLLYRALEREQLALHYQPQVEMETGTIVGVEALLRWKLPDQGYVSPAAFIPLAEQTGLIQTIGLWVLETTCRQNKAWQAMGFPPVRMAVNISVQQLKNRGFVCQVAGVLGETGLSPASLELEVTESVANSGTDNMVELMERLKTLGVSLAIDDFGTQYSSLGRLKMMPIDRIKMDMQFVRGITSSDKDRAIAQGIIDLAKSLNMKILAEGVETDAQLGFLKQQACDEIQGYYYYKPMPAEEMERIFQGRLLNGQGSAEHPCQEIPYAMEGGDGTQCW